jgi:paraquat-inducible protein B
MKASPSARLIGLFVLGGLLLGSILLLMFGSGHYFSKVQRYVTYFDGSVNGLVTGAPVKLRGVAIGRVNDVLVQYDTEHNRVLTPVVAEIDLEKVMETYGRDSDRSHQHPTLDELIDRGLRARLSLQSLVTNQLYVDIDFQPDHPGHLVGEKVLGLPEIPTIPSSKDEIEKTVQQVAKQVRDLPLKDTFDATLGVIRRVDGLLTKPETDASIVNLNQTLLDLQRLLRHLDSKVDSASGNLDLTAKEMQQLIRRLDATVSTLTTSVDGAVRDGHLLVNHLNAQIPPLLSNTNEGVKQARKTLSAFGDLTEPDSELSNTMRDVSEAARAIRRLADTLERSPDNLLYGKKSSEANR